MNAINNPEIQRAIALGYVFDDSGNDVRKTNVIDIYDCNGNPDDSAVIYRLWPDDKSAPGVAFSVFEDRTEAVFIDAADGYVIGRF